MGIQHHVPLVPQTTDNSCWAAGIAMIIGWRRGMSIDPSMIATNPGGSSYMQSMKTGLDPNDTYILARWGLRAEAPASYMPEGIEDMLRRYGPLWVASAVPGPHIRVITGIQVGKTAADTILYINDPWEKGMRVFRWPNRGSKYTENYKQFVQQYERLGRREFGHGPNTRGYQPAPIYVAHLP
jgi:Papain-like cysteine protease AvrRpt2